VSALNLLDLGHIISSTTDDNWEGLFLTVVVTPELRWEWGVGSGHLIIPASLLFAFNPGLSMPKGK